MDKEKNIKKSAGAAENIKKKNAHPTSAVPEGIRGLERNQPQTPTSELAASVDANTPNLLPDSSTLNASENTTPSYENNENISNELQQPQQVMMPPQGMPQGEPMPQGMPQGVQMPPMLPMQQGPHYNSHAQRTWRERMMGRLGLEMRAPIGKGARTIPNWLNGKPMAFFFVSVAVCWMAFGHVPAFDLVMAAFISVVVFFYGGYTMSRNWSKSKEKAFLKNVVIVGIILRLLWAFYGYFFFNMDHYGYVYGDDADTGWYMRFAKDLAQWIAGDSRRTLTQIVDYNGSAIDDTGYPMWLGIVYFLTGGTSDVVAPFILKSILGAYCAISIYHVAKRHFGEGAARMAAIFICLNPNMIYWCGTMMKETEMVFLCCLSIDLVDEAFTSGQKLSFRGLLPGILAGFALFFFRAALGAIVFLAMASHIVMASRRVMSVGKKVIAGVLVAATLFVGMGDRLRTQTERIMDSVQNVETNSQRNAQWRSTREGGNSFAKYAGAAVFAPLIFTIPFPTYNVVDDGQLVQVQVTGGSYIKNIFSYFVLAVLFILFISGEWRRHVFILAYTMGYMACLVMSNFAHSGRFHMPVVPMLMLFAAYGIQMAKGNAKLRKGFTWALVLEILICLAWNWFKLKGRGMI